MNYINRLEIVLKVYFSSCVVFPRDIGVILLCCVSIFSLADAADLLEKKITLEIAANSSIEDALIQWGEQSGLQVMMDSNTVHRNVPSALKGTLTARDALSRLLLGSGLSYSVEGQTLRVVRATSANTTRPTSARPNESTTGQVDPKRTAKSIKPDDGSSSR